jgi:hypothetical protein
MGSSTDPNNYRPISILPILSNILERIIYEGILNHFSDNDCIFKYQSGFRFNDGTNRALLSLIEKWQNEINFKRIIAVFFQILKRILIVFGIKHFLKRQKVTGFMAIS